MGDPVILTDRGPWYREGVFLASRAGFTNHVYQTFGLRSSVGGAIIRLPQTQDAGVPQQHNPKKTLFGPFVGFLELFVHWYTKWR